jgi:DnaJ-domain-containing protein 1
MLELPGRLERSTLGDVLGALHRSGATGVLRIDESGPGGSKQHVIYLRDGLIADVESGGSTPTPRSEPARRQCLAQLEALFELQRAQLTFRVMGKRSAQMPQPLEPPEFLHGRRRRRDVAAAREPERTPRELSSRERALALFGLSEEASAEEIRSAFCQLARRWHPDRHPDAGELTRAALCRRFAQITAAYQELSSVSDAPAARAANAR